MRKIRDVLRLSAAGMARRAGLGWPLPEGLAEEALESRPGIGGHSRTGRRSICAEQG